MILKRYRKMNTQLAQVIKALSPLNSALNSGDVAPIMAEHLPNILASDDLIDKKELIIDENVPYTKHNVYTHNSNDEKIIGQYRC